MINRQNFVKVALHATLANGKNPNETESGMLGDSPAACFDLHNSALFVSCITGKDHNKIIDISFQGSSFH